MFRILRAWASGFLGVDDIENLQYRPFRHPLLSGHINTPKAWPVAFLNDHPLLRAYRMLAAISLCGCSFLPMWYHVTTGGGCQHATIKDEILRNKSVDLGGSGWINFC